MSIFSGLAILERLNALGKAGINGAIESLFHRFEH
jgi:hypothetical protein